MKRQYELMVVTKTTFPFDDEKKRTELLEKLIGSDASVIDHTLLGKKQLAYPIQKHEDGVYILANVEGNIKVSEIEKVVNLGEEVLRYLLTKVEARKA